jgi:hypothetical protein
VVVRRNPLARPVVLGQAAAYAALGRFEIATATAAAAADLARAGDQASFAAEIENRRSGYENGVAFTDPSLATPP